MNYLFFYEPSRQGFINHCFFLGITDILNINTLFIFLRYPYLGASNISEAKLLLFIGVTKRKRYPTDKYQPYRYPHMKRYSLFCGSGREECKWMGRINGQKLGLIKERLFYLAI